MGPAPCKTSKSIRKSGPLNPRVNHAHYATAAIGDTDKTDRPIKSTTSLHSFLSSSSKSSLSTASSAGSLRSFRVTPRKGARLLPRAHKRGGRNKPIVVRDSSSGECREPLGNITRGPLEKAIPNSDADAAEKTRRRDVGPIDTLEELRELQLKILRSLVNRALFPRSKGKKPYQPLKLGAPRPSPESSSSRLASMSKIEDILKLPHPDAKRVTGSPEGRVSLSQVDAISDSCDLIVEDTTLVDDCSPQKCVSNGKENVLGLVKSASIRVRMQTKTDAGGTSEVPNELPGLNRQDSSYSREAEPHQQAGQSVVSWTCSEGSAEGDVVSALLLRNEYGREPIAPTKAIKKVEMDVRKKPMRHREKTLRMPDSTSVQARSMWSTISQHSPCISGLADSAFTIWNRQQVAREKVAGPFDRENLAIALEARHQELQLLKTEIFIIEEQLDYIRNDLGEHIIDEVSQGDEVVFTHVWDHDAVPGTSFNSAPLLEEGVLLDVALPASDSVNSVFRLLDIMAFPLKFVWRLAYRT